jgi:hypothetical protein
MPTVTGTVTGYTVTPALPAGLAIDATTGAVSGTPTQAAAVADYTITASNAGGSTTFPLKITVNAAAPPSPPPSGLTYASPQTFTIDAAITALTPTVTGTVSTYAVAPALPAGLAIDATTGAISGTPTAVTAETPYTITASNSAGSTTFALTLATLLERATKDRADQPPAVANTVDDQVHFLYVVPAGTDLDRRFDTLGSIEGSVRNWNNWLATQTGGPKLRLDTYGAKGRLDVTFVQLSQDETTLLGTAGTVRVRLENLLLAKGFDATNKIYLAYYEGDGAGCGASAWPPTLHGSLAILYLRGLGTVGPPATPDCPAVTFAKETDPTGEWEYRAAHEVLHPLGLAPPCAAHSSGNGHVDDDTRDLLYMGGLPPAVPKRVDLGRDDYFGGGLPAACPGPDLMNSAYLDPKPAGPQEPPGQPYVNLTTTAACAVEGTVPNTPTATDTTITFVNDYAPGGTGTALSVVQLVSNAGVNTRTNVNSLPYHEGLTLNGQSNTPAKVGMVYVVTTGGLTGQCQAIVTATATPSRFVIHTP